MYGDYLLTLSPSLSGLIAPKSPAQVAACSEALHGIRLLKTFAWEAAALRRIGRLRRAEWEPARDFVAAWRASHIALSRCQTKHASPAISKPPDVAKAISPRGKAIVLLGFPPPGGVK